MTGEKVVVASSEVLTQNFACKDTKTTKKFSLITVGL